MSHRYTIFALKQWGFSLNLNYNNIYFMNYRWNVNEYNLHIQN